MSIHHSPGNLIFIDDGLLFRASDKGKDVEVRIADDQASSNGGTLLLEAPEIRHLHSWLGDLIKRYDNHGRQDA